MKSLNKNRDSHFLICSVFFVSEGNPKVIFLMFILSVKKKKSSASIHCLSWNEEHFDYKISWFCWNFYLSPFCSGISVWATREEGTAFLIASEKKTRSLMFRGYRKMPTLGSIEKRKTSRLVDHCVGCIGCHVTLLLSRRHRNVTNDVNLQDNGRQLFCI